MSAELSVPLLAFCKLYGVAVVLAGRLSSNPTIFPGTDRLTLLRPNTDLPLPLQGYFNWLLFLC